jgi:hypothetical protein
MVERLLGGGEGVIVVVGEAGTGKTYALPPRLRDGSTAGRGELGGRTTSPSGKPPRRRSARRSS